MTGIEGPTASAQITPSTTLPSSITTNVPISSTKTTSGAIILPNPSSGFSPYQAEQQGYTVTPSSTAPEGYTLTSPIGTITDVYGNLIPSANPNTVITAPATNAGTAAATPEQYVTVNPGQTQSISTSLPHYTSAANIAASYTPAVAPASLFTGNNIDYPTFGQNAGLTFSTPTQYSGSYVNNDVTYYFTGSVFNPNPLIAENTAVDTAYGFINNLQMPKYGPGYLTAPVYINLDTGQITGGNAVELAPSTGTYSVGGKSLLYSTAGTPLPYSAETSIFTAPTAGLYNIGGNSIYMTAGTQIPTSPTNVFIGNSPTATSSNPGAGFLGNFFNFGNGIQQITTAQQLASGANLAGLKGGSYENYGATNPFQGPGQYIVGTPNNYSILTNPTQQTIYNEPIGTNISYVGNIWQGLGLYSFNGKAQQPIQNENAFINNALTANSIAGTPYTYNTTAQNFPIVNAAESFYPELSNALSNPSNILMLAAPAATTQAKGSPKFEFAPTANVASSFTSTTVSPPSVNPFSITVKEQPGIPNSAFFPTNTKNPIMNFVDAIIQPFESNPIVQQNYYTFTFNGGNIGGGQIGQYY